MAGEYIPNTTGNVPGGLGVFFAMGGLNQSYNWGNSSTTKIIHNRWHDGGLRVAGNPWGFTAVYHTSVYADANLKQISVPIYMTQGGIANGYNGVAALLPMIHSSVFLQRGDLVAENIAEGKGTGYQFSDGVQDWVFCNVQNVHFFVSLNPTDWPS